MKDGARRHNHYATNSCSGHGRVLAAYGYLPLLAAEKERKARRPNIIYIMTDQQSASMMTGWFPAEKGETEKRSTRQKQKKK